MWKNIKIKQKIGFFFFLSCYDCRNERDKLYILTHICEVAWDFQAHIGNYCFELMGFKHKKSIFLGFPFFSFLLTINHFSLVKKYQSSKETLNMLNGIIVKITATLHENFP